MLGQIATFIEDLHLSYEDVVNRIPYRNLLIMKKDKLHEAYGDVITRVSGRELADRRKGEA